MQIIRSNSQQASSVNALYEYIPIEMSSMLSNSTLGLNTIYFVPIDINNPVSAARICIPVSLATVFTATNTSGFPGFTLSAGVYTRMSGASSERMSLLASGSQVVLMSQSSDSATYLYPSGTGTATSAVGANASTFAASSIGGFRMMDIGLNQGLSAGRYFVGIGYSSASTHASGILRVSVMQQTQAQIGFAPFGTSSSASNAASALGVLPGLGAFSVTSGAFPNSIALTGGAIVLSITQTLPAFVISGFAGTATNIL